MVYTEFHNAINSPPPYLVKFKIVRGGLFGMNDTVLKRLSTTCQPGLCV